MNGTAELLIARLGLRPLPSEGGYFVETYRSAETLSFSGSPRACSTAIYYLLTDTSCSKMHRLASDEIWHFYLGDPVAMLQLSPTGPGKTIILGPDLLCHHACQTLVPKGTWQGARLLPGGRFALMGCTVAPGFDFADFEIADRASLLARYPHCADRIIALT